MGLQCAFSGCLHLTLICLTSCPEMTSWKSTTVTPTRFDNTLATCDTALCTGKMHIMYVSTYVCRYVYVCMYVCLYLYVCICMYVYARHINVGPKINWERLPNLGNALAGQVDLGTFQLSTILVNQLQTIRDLREEIGVCACVKDRNKSRHRDKNWDSDTNENRVTLIVGPSSRLTSASVLMTSLFLSV